ncbi:MAG: hypothetical protein IPH94_20365 [Saprospiraceae bacterium]|nr:hypothetical protein [Saprospiraceae bacterium]
MIFHSGNELYEWRGNTLQTIQLPQSRENISYVFVDKENQIWISDNKASLLHTSNHFIHYTLSGLSDIQCSAFDGSNFYLGTSTGVFASPDPTGKEGKWILKKENITVIKVIYRKIWIGTFSNGLYVYDLESKRFHMWVDYLILTTIPFWTLKKQTPHQLKCQHWQE